ncbi:MAG: hypothetical protein M1834_002674 [Cirrosporium novae-zelandiae]|nr:MAG: hypothetical protein M1834_002674 [Cirrosporium novae-zelandiae]
MDTNTAKGSRYSNEQSSLLPHGGSTSNSQEAKVHPAAFMLTLCCFLAAVQWGACMMTAPQTQLFESIACYHHFRKNDPGRFPNIGDIPDRYCKIAPIESEVALIQGIGGSLEALPSILLSIPYGRLADNPKYGRKTVLMLSLIGTMMGIAWAIMVLWFSEIFPLRLVWLCPVFAVIGGGSGIITAMVFTMITDVVDAENRTAAFFQLEIAAFIPQVFSPILAAWLMEKNPWIPLLLGCAILYIGAVFIIYIPETYHVGKSIGIGAQSHVQDTSGVEYIPGDSDPASKSSFPYFIQERLDRIWYSSCFIMKQPTLLILAAILVYMLGNSQKDILLLYASTRYGISLASAGLLLPLTAAVNVVLLLFLLPAVSTHLLTYRRYTSNDKDLFLSKVSIIHLTVGCFLLGLAPTLGAAIMALIIYTLGSGLSPLTRNLLTSFIDPRHVASLNSVISVVQRSGELVGGPFIAWSYDLGLGMGDAWLGLPFAGTGVLHALATLGVCLVKLPRETDDVEDDAMLRD